MALVNDWRQDPYFTHRSQNHLRLFYKAIPMAGYSFTVDGNETTTGPKPLDGSGWDIVRITPGFNRIYGHFSARLATDADVSGLSLGDYLYCRDSGSNSTTRRKKVRVKKIITEYTSGSATAEPILVLEKQLHVDGWPNPEYNDTNGYYWTAPSLFDGAVKELSTVDQANGGGAAETAYSVASWSSSLHAADSAGNYLVGAYTHSEKEHLSPGYRDSFVTYHQSFPMKYYTTGWTPGDAVDGPGMHRTYTSNGAVYLFSKGVYEGGHKANLLNGVDSNMQYAGFLAEDSTYDGVVWAGKWSAPRQGFLKNPPKDLILSFKNAGSSNTMSSSGENGALPAYEDSSEAHGGWLDVAVVCTDLMVDFYRS